MEKIRKKWSDSEEELSTEEREEEGLTAFLYFKQEENKLEEHIPVRELKRNWHEMQYGANVLVRHYWASRKGPDLRQIYEHLLQLNAKQFPDEVSLSSHEMFPNESDWRHFFRQEEPHLKPMSDLATVLQFAG